MTSASFLLLINASVGLVFAVAFVGFSLPQRVALGFWCAGGFVCAAFTVGVESFSSVASAPQIVSALSFTSFLGGLCLIAVGVSRHYGKNRSRLLAALFFFFLSMQVLLVAGLERDTISHAVGYQIPFAIMTGFAATCVLNGRKGCPTRTHYWLAAVLALSSIQFLGKALIAYQIGSGADVKSYLVSSYAHYSQTLGAILSLLLGMSLLAVIVQESMQRTRQDLQKDHLSGLWTRGAFFERAKAALLTARPGVSPFLVLCDLDHFKRINDTFGHAAGDEVIRAFARCLEGVGGEICGRLGGEEFAVFFLDGTPATVRLYVEGLRASFSQVNTAGTREHVSASYGIVSFESTETLEDALRRADIALYQAKAAGRNTYRIAEAEDRSEQERVHSARGQNRPI